VRLQAIVNIDRHHRIAAGRDGGEDELKEALRRVGHGGARINALTLGNWLTDVTQCIDPVAVAKLDLRGKASKLFDDLARWLVPILALGSRPPFDTLQRSMDAVRDEMLESIDWLLEPRGGDPRDNRLFRNVADLIKLTGYLKFVHPDGPGKPRRLDFKAYLAIVNGKQLGQYYAHDHLDRPEEPTGLDPPSYASDVVRPRRTYDYLLKDMTMIAGSLAEIEKSWATPSFDEAEVDDTSVEWNERLAWLGRALHQVEDFFAHSNFVELAAAFNPRYRAKRVGGIVTARTYLMRLKRWRRFADPKPEDLGSVPFEINLVTGYFDAEDTIVSLSHLLEDVLGLRFTDFEDLTRQVGAAATDPGRFLSEFGQDLVYEVGEIVNDPQTALRDEDNALGRYLKRNHGPAVEAILGLSTDPLAYARDLASHERVKSEVLDTLLADSELWAGTPPEAREWFASSIGWLGEVRKIGGTVRSLYEVVQLVVAMYSSLERLVKAIEVWSRLTTDVPPGVRHRGPRRLVRLAFKSLVALVAFMPQLRAIAEIGVRYYARAWVYERIGGRRIGSHSLLAKDDDDALPFADEAFDLARAAHRYLVHVMVRNDPDLPARPTDWEKVVELLLSHPAEGPKWFDPVMKGGLRSRRGVLPATLRHPPRSTSARNRDRLIQDAWDLRGLAEPSSLSTNMR